MTTPTVIYHSADFDGIFCREIAKRFLPNATLIGWNFGDALISPPPGPLYILDLSPDCIQPECRLSWSDFVWIDHHKTSIETHPSDIPGYRIDGVAACRLAWQWFTDDGGKVFPACKEPYVDREVNEPLAVRLAGEYDIWDKRDPNAETFQYSLRIEEPNWQRLLDGDETYTLWLLDSGRAIQKYEQGVNASICNHKTWIMEWEGLRFLCVNSARFNSLLFTAKDVPETGHDALLGFCYTGKTWTVSLYHAKHRTDLDLSKIAIRYGGGGHRGACGFTCQTLPFMQNAQARKEQ